MTEEDDVQLPDLVLLGNPRLAQPSAPVDVAQIRSEDFQFRLQLLHQAMVANQGIGIAAPQIGWFERFFIMATEDEEDGDETGIVLDAWINPEIVSFSGEFNWAWEGCLSVPGMRGWIRRPAAVAVRGLNHEGEQVSRDYAGWDARLLQHEFDHLDGLLFPYRTADPRHLVALEEMELRESWPEDWPAEGARDTPMGSVFPE